MIGAGCTYACEEPILRDVEYRTIKPSTSTVCSIRVDHTWSESNCRRMGLSDERDAISPTEARRVSMRGMILNCEIAVNASIRTTSKCLNSNARKLPCMVRLHIKELARNANPKPKAIQCSFSSELRTTSPAM